VSLAAPASTQEVVNVAESRRRLLIAFPSWLADEIAGVIAEAVNAHAAGQGR
jgi:hypothetical protein